MLGGVRRVISGIGFCFRRGFSVKKIGGAGGRKLGPLVEKKELPVESDVALLASRCCGSNIYKSGDDVTLRPDADYPDWLWKLRYNAPPPSLDELDPNTLQYWHRYRKLAKRRQKMLSKGKRF